MIIIVCDHVNSVVEKGGRAAVDAQVEVVRLYERGEGGTWHTRDRAEGWGWAPLLGEGLDTALLRKPRTLRCPQHECGITAQVTRERMARVLDKLDADPEAMVRAFPDSQAGTVPLRFLTTLAGAVR